MIGIRADANDKIAMGHVMRCIAIARQMKNNGNDIIFISSDDFIKDRIILEGFEFCHLNNDYNKKESEIDTMLEVIEKNNIETLLIDSYQVTELYMQRLHEKVRLIYIDDLNAFTYPADVIINYAYNADASMYKNYDEDVKFYLGSSYIPLREEFANNSIEIKENVEGIFITTGGTDTFDMVMKLLGKLNSGIFKSIKKYVVVGKFYDKYDELKEMQNNTLYVFQNINNMYEVMKKCDVAISAGGTTVSELCAMGLATIAFTMADNQLNSTKAYDEDGIIIYSGDVRNNRDEVIDNIIFNLGMLIDDYDFRKKMSIAARTRIDGKGAKRIANIMI